MTAIPGATSSTYVPVTADIGQNITCTVTATNSAGNASATSAAVGPITSATSSQVAQFLARTSGLDTTHTNAYTALIDGLVADGVWPKLDVLHVYATQDSTTALLNLVSSNYTGSLLGTPSFTADRGFTGSIGAVGMNTNFNPVTATSPNYTQNSAHMSVWNLTNAATTSPSIGFEGSGFFAAMWVQYTDSKTHYVVNASSSADVPVANADARGHYIANRSTSTAMQLYKNGSSAATNSSASSIGVLSENIYCLGDNLAGTAQGVAQQHAMLSAGSSLSSTDATNLYNRLRTYMTAVGVP